MVKYTWEYDDVVFKLSISDNTKSIIDDYKIERTVLYIGGYGLSINEFNSIDFLHNIKRDIEYYKTEITNEQLNELERRHIGILFTRDYLYFKKHYTDTWNIISGDDYIEFYNWIICCILPKEEGRELKINNILNKMNNE